MCVNGTDPLAAIIAAVWSARCVNLAVFDANGGVFNRTSVVLVQPEDTKPETSFCQWMPFQIAQAQTPAPAPDPTPDPAEVPAT
jgi:hypothetical protein